MKYKIRRIYEISAFMIGISVMLDVMIKNGKVNPKLLVSSEIVNSIFDASLTVILICVPIAMGIAGMSHEKYLGRSILTFVVDSLDFKSIFVFQLVLLCLSLLSLIFNLINTLFVIFLLSIMLITCYFYTTFDYLTHKEKSQNTIDKYILDEYATTSKEQKENVVDQIINVNIEANKAYDTFEKRKSLELLKKIMKQSDNNADYEMLSDYLQEMLKKNFKLIDADIYFDQLFFLEEVYSTYNENGIYCNFYERLYEEIRENLNKVTFRKYRDSGFNHNDLYNLIKENSKFGGQEYIDQYWRLTHFKKLIYSNLYRSKGREADRNFYEIFNTKLFEIDSLDVFPYFNLIMEVYQNNENLYNKIIDYIFSGNAIYKSDQNNNLYLLNFTICVFILSENYFDGTGSRSNLNLTALNAVNAHNFFTKVSNDPNLLSELETKFEEYILFRLEYWERNRQFEIDSSLNVFPVPFSKWSEILILYILSYSPYVEEEKIKSLKEGDLEFNSESLLEDFIRLNKIYGSKFYQPEEQISYLQSLLNE